MSKYDYSAYRIDETTTREYTFSDLVGEPSLIVAVANDVNRRFKLYRVRKSLELADSITTPVAKSASLDDRAADMLRRLDDDVIWERDIIAKACVTSWGTPPVDLEGNAPEFNGDEALEFLNSLPEHMYTPFKNYVGNIYNFQNYPDPKLAADKLGNSSRPDSRGSSDTTETASQ